MNILLAYDGVLPATHYGGVERVIWALAMSLNNRGHNVTLLAASSSHCQFAKVIIYDPGLSLNEQVPDHIDLVHCHFPFNRVKHIDKPLVVTLHGNAKQNEHLHPNTVFLSKNHAQRHGGECVVYNGLNWNDYPTPDFSKTRKGFHFLGKAAWRVKNVNGAIKTVLKLPKETLNVVGGNRLNFKMGFRFTLTQRVKFYGTVGGQEKFDVLNQSKGLVFPVLWDEPFGLAIIESLYFGCPVYGTPYGSLPELINSSVGVLSNSSDELALAMTNNTFNVKDCYEYANDSFNADRLCEDYINIYEKVLNNYTLNSKEPEAHKLNKNIGFLFY